MPTMNLNWVRWDETKKAKVVGWPLPTPANPVCAYQRIASLAPTLKSIGITRALIKPVTEGASGTSSIGYDKKDDYSFNNTAWGQETDAVTATDALDTHGIRVMGDLVLHQMSGYPKQEYKTAKFPKTPACFAWYPGMANPKYPGNVGPDSVPDPNGGWPDGDLCAYDQPDRYMWNGAIEATLNQMRMFGIRDWRIDEAKDLHAPFLCALIDAVLKVYPDATFTGEYFDGNNNALGGWVNYWMSRRASVFDFGFKFNIGRICNNNSNSWMGRLAEIGYCMQDSMRAVTFVENADTDTTLGQQTIWNKQLGYDAMFSLPGDPMIYYRDWAKDPNCYGMTDGINNGLWRWHNLAQGAFVARHADFQTFVCERMGYGSAPGCVCFFSNDQWNEHTVTVQTRYGANVRLHEYSGHAGYSSDIWTDRDGRITRRIPRNVNGCNSEFYAPYI